MPDPGTSAGGPSEPDGLRVVGWNVRDLLGDPLAVHRVLRTVAPDVLCLQEAPRRPGSRWRLGALARACGLLYVAGGRESGGTAVLVSLRAEVGAVKGVRLPVSGRTARSRGAVVAEVGLPGRDRVAVACVHLGLDAAERARHVHDVRVLAAASGLPLVVVGDLNERPGGPSWRSWGADVLDPAPGAAPTFPAVAPWARIDAVLVGGGVEVLGYGDGGATTDDVLAASDHVPVVAVLRTPRRSGGPTVA